MYKDIFSALMFPAIIQDELGNCLAYVLFAGSTRAETSSVISR